jgi:hypothetical protein
LVVCALAFIERKVPKLIAANTTMMAMTTSNSTRVKPLRRTGIEALWDSNFMVSLLRCLSLFDEFEE